MLSKCIDLKLTGSLQQTVAQQLWEMIGVDVMGPFPRNINQNVYLLVCVDYFSQWVELFLLRKATADSGERDMTHWACLITFCPSVELSLFPQSSRPLQTWKVGHQLMSVCHSQTNLTERVNRTLKTINASDVGTRHEQR